MRDNEFYREKGYRDAVEYYRETKWEDTGYLSPELSTQDTYPDYIREEAQISAYDVNKHLDGDNTITFGFMTDLHYATTENHRIRMKRMLNAYKDICNKTHNRILLIGGDLTNEGCREYKIECFKELKQQFSDIRYFPCNGNHDDGTIWDIQYIDNDKSENHLTQAERYDLFYSHLKAEKAVFPDGEKVLYYYVDDEKNKTRFIALDSGDVPQNMINGKLVHSAQWEFAMSQKQTDWLINDALSLSTEGWSIIIFVHSMIPPSSISEACKQAREKWYLNHIEDILDSFKQRGKVYASYYDHDFKIDVNADFASYKNADLIGFFVGDFHRDMVDYTKGNIPKIFTANSVTYRGTQDRPPRNDGDKSEMLFDMVTVNKKTRNVHLTRVGCGNDRDVQY